MKGVVWLLGLLASCWLAVCAAEALIPGLEGYTTEADALLTLRDARSLVKQGSIALDKATGEQELELAMSRGWFELSQQLLHVYKAAPQPVDLTGRLHSVSSRVRRSLQALAESLQPKRKASRRGIAPAFQWAQSPDSVFLNVKFAAKWDTPATLGCKLGKVDIKERRLDLWASCKSKRKKFHLGLDLLKGVLPQNSTYNMGSVGRAAVTLRKAGGNNTWSRLLKTRKKPSNMHLWWEVREEWEDAMEDLQKNETARRNNLTAAELAAERAEEEAKAAAEAAAEASQRKQKKEVEGKGAAGAKVLPPLDGGEAPAQQSESARAARRVQAAREAAERDAARELRAKLSAVDIEARDKKNEVDRRSREEKKQIDEQTAASKAELRQKRDEELAATLAVLADAEAQAATGDL